MLFSIYPKELSSLLEKKRGYVPRKLRCKESLKLYHKYWNLDIPNYIFKVDNIFNIQGIEYYQVRSIDALYQSTLSFPIMDDTCFELIQDHNNIKDLPNIINSSTAYFGSEIRYWFFENKIAVEDEKYIGFKPYIEYSGKSSLADNKIYFLKGELNDRDIYVNCHAISNR